MQGIIQLLPDDIINQIAAGEVVQRPSSVVKELVENSIDAGASHIKVTIVDAGRTLIQVIDNGSGMSPVDATLCFERHATSKIRTVEDLFRIYTMGFRGEALASIAAVAQVELKTKRIEDEIGTMVSIHASKIIANEPVLCPNGTSISVKNLFYNIPARRNFLKSDAVEFRHILEEMYRQVLAHPNVAFTLHHNQQEVFNLPISNLGQRIVHLLGKNYTSNLVPVQEQSNGISIKGYISKPDFVKKTRGEQFFFINKRFIKDTYLNHAVISAYEEMLPKGSYPFYCLFLAIDPKHIDVNIHPTKTEVKFDDEKIVYTTLRAAVRVALNTHNIQPQMNFDTNQTTFQNLVQTKNLDFNSKTNSYKPPRINPTEKQNIKHFQELFHKSQWQQDIHHLESTFTEAPTTQQTFSQIKHYQQSDNQNHYWQLHRKYIFAQMPQGVMLIDQHAAHERILYEVFYRSLTQQQGKIQTLLFPIQISLSPIDLTWIREMYSEVRLLGFDIELQSDSILLKGVPADLPPGKESTAIQELIEQFRMYEQTLKLEKRDNLAKSLACRAAIKTGEALTMIQMKNLVDQLFGCTQPYSCPHGRPTAITLTVEELDKLFGRIGHLER
ncbi:MAG: DNA mismatch repair endonuclease MutL [Bacteroidia bacterium]|nr:DNA mismatch repair endonuclease MutL [Bacteroidia bacterium]MDW8348081.1 DNA mismatch repair endonuclease MutL [Bacteroidia bacterium]